MGQASTLHLSKSKYMSGYQCPKRLWLELHQKQEATETDIELQFLFDEGNAVGTFAREWRGKGELINVDYENLDQAFKDTQAALEKNTKRIYEAGFQKGPYRAFVDIIEELDDGTWRVLEVKSTGKAKDVHIPDLAFQVWLLKENGLIVSEAGVVHLNSKGVWPKKKSILKITDVTEAVFDEIKSTKQLAKNLIPIAEANAMPDIDPGDQCNDPYVCDFQEFCGLENIENSYIGIPSLMPKHRIELEVNGWNTIEEIPLDNDVLSEKQNRWLRAIRKNKPYIDPDFINEWLSQLRYPIYSFDFETIAYRLPRFDGSSPFQQVPFQFSCHKQNKEGNIIEAGAYLHPDKSDPRPLLIKAMVKALGNQGSILAWSASFEKTIINRLIKDFPEFKSELTAINERFLDPIEIFRKAYFHPKALGSASIKDVGKALLDD